VPVSLTRFDYRAGIFHWPVDPVALNIPRYWDVIPKKNGRDLSTIKGKVEKKAYSSFQDLDADVRLMFENAYKFNGRGSEIGTYTSDLERIWGDILRARAAENNRTHKKPRLV
jgi:transcription initiation factor TFIID subunit 2